MKRLDSLPFLLAALALSPLVAQAQAGASAPTQAATSTAPALYAESGSPTAFSTLADQPMVSTHHLAASAAGSAASAAAPSSEGSHKPLSGLAVGVKFGLAGIGFDVATPLVPRYLNLRGGASFFSYSTTITSDNLNIAGAIKFQNAEAVVDYFPFHGRFRLSGGMTFENSTYLNATLTPAAGSSFTLGNTKYYSNPSNPAVGNGIFNFGGKVAPRVSIGTGNMLPAKGRWTFESELGVQFTSQPTVVYTFTGQGCTGYNGVTYTGCGPIAQSDINQEESNLQGDLMDLRYFPVLEIGLSYKIH